MSVPSLKEMALRSIPTEDSHNIDLFRELSQGIPNREALLRRFVRRNEMIKINEIYDIVHQHQAENGLAITDDVIRFKPDISGRTYSLVDVLDDDELLVIFLDKYLKNITPRRRQNAEEDMSRI